MNEEIKFYRSKKKLIILMLMAALICLLGLFIIFGMDGWGIYFTLAKLFEFNKTAFGLTIILSFLLVIIILLRKLRSNEPAVIINSDFVCDKSASTSVGEITWSDITGLNTIVVAGQKILLLKVVNPEKYLNRIKPGIKRKLLEATAKSNGTPIAISATGLLCTFEELHEAIKSRILDKS